MKNLKISTRLYMLVLFALAMMGAATLYSLMETQKNMEGERKAMLQAMTETAVNIFKANYALEQKGELTREQAQQRASDTIRAMRYQKTGYFWINDMQEKILMHPAKPELEGTDQSQNKDPYGKYIFVEFVKIVQAQGAGFVDYWWPKPGFDQPVQKFSYVAGFEPWGWVVGTGVYADDLESLFWRNALQYFTLGAVVGAMILLAAWAIVRSVVQPIERLKNSMQAISEENVSAEVPETGRTDEIGSMAKVLVVLRDSVADRIQLRIKEIAQQEAIITERRGNEAQALAQSQAQARAMDTLAAQLQRLAQGDLTAQVSDISADYAALKDNFNSTVESLQAVIRSIRTSSDVVDESAENISGATNNLSRRTEQQAAALEQTAAALDEITSTVRSSADRAAEARRVVSETKASAGRSGDIVRNAIHAMGRIEESSGRIGQIITVIDEIAFQTNLLALNAGVEAARAGDAGKGFAVVAQEVRELAQRSASAAKEIKQLVQNSSAEVESGVTLVRSTGEALTEIETLVNEVNDHVVAIALAAKEQAMGLAEVNTAVNSMDQMTQQNAAMVEETTAASQTLAQESQALKAQLRNFHVSSGQVHRANQRNAA